MLKTWFRKLRRTAPTKKLYATSGSRVDALCRTLTAGQKVLRSDRERSASAGEAALTPPKLLAALEAWLKTPAPEALGGELDSSHGSTVIRLTIPSEIVDLVISYRGTAIRYLRGRAFFTTREGFIGLARASAREGDYVCLAHGASTPIVLRELDGARGGGRRRPAFCGSNAMPPHLVRDCNKPEVHLGYRIWRIQKSSSKD